MKKVAAGDVLDVVGDQVFRSLFRPAVAEFRAQLDFPAVQVHDGIDSPRGDVVDLFRVTVQFFQARLGFGGNGRVIPFAGMLVGQFPVEQPRVNAGYIAGPGPVEFRRGFPDQVIIHQEFLRENMTDVGDFFVDPDRDGISQGRVYRDDGGHQDHPATPFPGDVLGHVATGTPANAHHDVAGRKRPLGLFNGFQIHVRHHVHHVRVPRAVLLKQRPRNLHGNGQHPPGKISDFPAYPVTRVDDWRLVPVHILSFQNKTSP